MVANHGESDQDDGVDDDASGPDQPGSDVNDDGEVVDVGPINKIGLDMYISDEVVPAKALKRKGRAVQVNVDMDVILETSASEAKEKGKREGC